MSKEFWLKTSSDDEVFTPYLMTNKPMNTLETNTTSPHKVFRNDTTSVEVIVKQVKNKKKMEPSKHKVALEEINDRLCEDIENLKRELNKANKNLENTKKCFRLVMFEMAKQLEAANQRELRRQTKYLVQQLEKEKLKTILESKTNLVRKLRKELLNVKRITKVVIKGIQCVPLPETAVQHSDLEYTEFENDLKTPKTSIADNNIMCGGHEDTCETTLSYKF
ncbi:uncharacterized protein LOC123875145 [Maniola jurtina]|uniref:uncharacterized protein LOC123875145 n=1 Tax=Maniola jurtina TaxID=191418 RepID=UPI001E689DB4|nr:uncharacterized protein LOC123875145 [Maniola jurtina]